MKYGGNTNGTVSNHMNAGTQRQIGFREQDSCRDTDHRTDSRRCQRQPTLLPNNGQKRAAEINSR